MLPDAPPIADADLAGRRPLRSRGSPWAVGVASWLVRRGASPNGISVASIAVSAAGAAAIVATRYASVAVLDALALLVAAGCVQGRLLCNLFDGMVAVEGGKRTPVGDLYNEAPDRAADTLLLVAAGYVADPIYGPTLGWAAALLAMATAYVRVLGKSAGAVTTFAGPMAKQHRMALLTIACLLGAILAFARPAWVTWTLTATLALIAAGSLVTTFRRLATVAADLRQNAGAAR